MFLTLDRVWKWLWDNYCPANTAEHSAAELAAKFVQHVGLSSDILAQSIATYFVGKAIPGLWSSHFSDVRITNKEDFEKIMWKLGKRTDAAGKPPMIPNELRSDIIRDIRTKLVSGKAEIPEPDARTSQLHDLMKRGLSGSFLSSGSKEVLTGSKRSKTDLEHWNLVISSVNRINTLVLQRPTSERELDDLISSSERLTELLRSFQRKSDLTRAKTDVS